MLPVRGQEFTWGTKEYVVNDLPSGQSGFWVQRLGLPYGHTEIEWMDKDHWELGLVAGYIVPRTTTTTKEPTCWHEWKRYTGFSEIYDYCVKCNKKGDPICMMKR